MKSKFSVLLVGSLFITGVSFLSVSYADTNDANQRINSTLSSNFSGVISNSDDQRSYDAAQKGRNPGIQVLGTEVMPFKTYVRPAGGRGGGGNNGGTRSNNLIDNTGTVMSTAHIYSIFWGSSFASPTYKTDIKAFLNGLNCATATLCTGLSNTVKQYMRGLPLTISVSSKDYVDASSSLLPAAPTSADIANEVAKVVNASGDILDPGALYVVFTDAFPANVGYCAWHSAAIVPNKNSVNTPIAVAYMPNLVNQARGCGSSTLPKYVLKTSVAVDSVINVTTHEIYETISDSLMGTYYAWIDARLMENGDKCAWISSTTSGGYTVQQEWSNSVSGCAAS